VADEAVLNKILKKINKKYFSKDRLKNEKI
jgi:hypothetical protein